jgi:hypothetical protein
MDASGRDLRDSGVGGEKNEEDGRDKSGCEDSCFVLMHGLIPPKHRTGGTQALEVVFLKSVRE